MLTLLFASAAFACEPADVIAATGEAWALLLDDRAAEALAVVRRSEAGVACTNQLLTVEQLTRYYHVAAAAAHAAGEHHLVAGWLRTAIAIGPTSGPDRSLPDAINVTWHQLAPAVIEGPKAELRAECQVRVDGWDMVAREKRLVPAGEHLVQKVDATGLVRSRMLAVRAGQSHTVCEAEGPGAARFVLGGLGAALAIGGMAVGFVGDDMASEDIQTATTLAIAGAVGTGVGVGLMGTAILLPTGGGGLAISGVF